MRSTHSHLVQFFYASERSGRRKPPWSEAPGISYGIIPIPSCPLSIAVYCNVLGLSIRIQTRLIQTLVFTADFFHFFIKTLALLHYCCMVLYLAGCNARSSAAAAVFDISCYFLCRVKINTINMSSCTSTILSTWFTFVTA